MSNNIVEIYKWCPACNKEGLIKDTIPEPIYIGVDGYSHPVTFSKCECGQSYGWFNISDYKQKQSFKFDDTFKSYLKRRINLHYKEILKEGKGRCGDCFF
ncbi:hypothetical protein QO179_25145 [Bacillus stercoris]|nr:hypothetical protein [Bacillus stercoris]